ncbi:MULTISPECIES: type IV pilus secretin PilQ [unclassified Neptuniibacter]|uniref:type IV pilus secretin PilQ n=1 Tax=unclassified Neptuniibacter TaxID=2630693 RepID=UPI0026E28602|nr:MULTISPECIES: type IV pilus secretin PilQ [unclassified Neptuniibacter]MDO6513836.1 type IV pilus secretin PilQ [Neptuniibacter sp. 2_MG-2023]MDO6593205.1 type IV pilus secretin PilQ [Neptuniibacter sp. 1_MG-2023]
MKIWVPMMTKVRVYTNLRWLSIALVSLLLSEWAAADVLMKNANFVALPGGKVEIRFDFDSAPPSPQAYMINQPARIVMDLWGVESDLTSRSLDVKTGQVDGISFAQTEGRLRIVANLYEPSSYKTFSEGNSLFVVVQSNNSGLPSTSETSENVVSKSSDSGSTTAFVDARSKVQGMDFERVEGGVGRVTITMSDDKAGVDIQEEGNNVVVNLVGADLSRALEQRVDVQDFVTPVMFIDSMANGGNTSILIKPSAEPYEYLAYQTDNQLILDFKPLSQAEKDERTKELFEFTGEQIDLNFQNVELRSVLQIIAEVAELNLVVSDSVGGNITLRLKNVPWDQALDIVLKTEGLDQRTVGNVLLIAPADEIAQREKAELESSQQVEQLAPLRTEFIQVDYRKASEMMGTIQGAKLVSERGFIMADDETNVLMVRETSNAIQEIRETLHRFDVEVEQVLIEARLVNATSNVTKDLGIKWGFGYNDVDNGKGWIVSQDQSSIDFSSTSPTSGLNVDLGATATNVGQIAIGFAPGASTLIGLELSALEADGKAEIVSQPKILTTNGKKALIQSGSEIPYQTVEDGEVSIEFKDVVLSLDVTPRINPGDRIAMELLIKQDSIGQVLANGELSIDNNELQTTVVVPDGQTIVLGGVFKHETSDSVNKVPLLGDLPIMGALFRNKESTSEKTELLIFITPKLVRNSLSQ